MSVLPEDIAIMRKVLDGKLKREKFSELLPFRLQVCAAVAYILLHREQYLDSNNFVLSPYEDLLTEIIGDKPPSGAPYSGCSLLLGLHSCLPANLPLVPRVEIRRPGGRYTVLRSVAKINPPDALKQLTGEELAALRFLQRIDKHSPEVARLVYENLKKRFTGN